MGKRWRITAHDAARIAHLERTANVPPVVAQLLVARGVYDPDKTRLFMDAKLTGLRDPDLLPGVTEAADRIYAAMQAKRRIVIYGDYDADGMSGTAVLYSCLRMLGADVGYYVPNRLEEGYGLNSEALETLARRGASLIVTVDCGIASVEQAKTARQLELELIITDHHEFADELPAADTLVHPRLPGHSYPFGELCGAGVAFKLAWAICQRASQSKRVSPPMRQFLLTAIGLAAIGTIGDVVPLVDENRILVRHGLASLAGQPPTGVAALLKIVNLNGRNSLSSEDVAFMIAPRINAAGRLGQAQLGVELLTTEDPERARALAEYIHELNNSRTSLERSIYLAARKQAQERFDPEHAPALVLAGQDWHPGVIGIVASRLADKYNVPVVILSLDPMGVKPATGSARSACGLHLHDALAQCSEHLLAHGGHAAAAGLKIKESRIDEFREAFCEHASGEINEEDRVAEIFVDAEAPFAQLTLQTVQQIEQMAPFGQGNPRPILVAGEVQLAGEPKRMGGGDRHLSLRLRQNAVTLRGIAFGQGDWAEELAQTDGPLDVAFRPVINEFAGRRSVELHLVDWRLSQARLATSG